MDKARTIAGEDPDPESMEPLCDAGANASGNAAVVWRSGHLAYTRAGEGSTFFYPVAWAGAADHTARARPRTSGVRVGDLPNG